MSEPKKTIWKYPVEIADEQSIKVPKWSTVRHVGLQQVPDRPIQQICIWIEVDPNEPEQTHGIYVVGTGHPVPENVNFIGSVIAEPFVWHVYTTIGSEW